MVFVVDALEEGGPDRMRRVNYEDFSSPDDVYGFITVAKGIVWWDRPHQGLDGETPAEVWTRTPNGPMDVWHAEFSAYPAFKKDPQRWSQGLI